MEVKRIKYKEYGWSGGGYGYFPSSMPAGYILKGLIHSGLYEIEDGKTQTKYQMPWATKVDFQCNYKKFEGIHAWYEALDPETQKTIIRIPWDNKLKEEV